ncbi:MAG: hypothetical protein H6709_13560 [Kofleriaceae bacterium]|nr:hypothetical protein [Myxococcales bacterium]MCB9561936.1 hypothetical protein [Kofleriaceae bacterium]MCB9573105.1 hypothetical protein [Kofleriaceae bacterium]
MLLAPTTYWFLFGLAVAIGVGGLIVIKAELPGKWPGRGGVAALIGGAIAAIYLYWWPTHVVVVSGGGAEMHVERYRLIGSTTLSLDGKPVTLTSHDDRTWVVNRSEREVRVSSFVYSKTSFPNYDEPDVIPPGTAREVVADEIEHVGPGDRPPRSISSDTGFEVKYWLTW